VRSEFETRREIVEIGRRLWERGYVAANDGNISVRLGDRIVVTPTGLSKGFLGANDMVVVSTGGEKLSGGPDPTSELPMHLAVYRARPDVSAVVHAHPPKATGFAVAGVPLAQCVLPEVILTLGEVPLAGYATPSTDEVVRALSDFVPRYNAILLSNHGALTLGADLSQAYYRMETVEHFAEITLAARALGGPSPLSSEDVRKLLSVREKLGLEGAAECAECGACDGSGVPASGGAAGGAPDEEEIVRAVLARLKGVMNERGDGR
jgi:L-fuculose-phosphate aldolase